MNVQMFNQLKLTPAALITLALLLVLPTIVVVRATGTIPFFVIPVFICFVSFGAYVAIKNDKMFAQTNEWRVPESTLHFLELIGGWPGSFVAQRLYRHKISKLSYQLIFWIIIIAYQAMAFEYLNNWKNAKPFLSYIFQNSNG